MNYFSTNNIHKAFDYCYKQHRVIHVLIKVNTCIRQLTCRSSELQTAAVPLNWWTWSEDTKWHKQRLQSTWKTENTGQQVPAHRSEFTCSRVRGHSLPAHTSEFTWSQFLQRCFMIWTLRLSEQKLQDSTGRAAETQIIWEVTSWVTSPAAHLDPEVLKED